MSEMLLVPQLLVTQLVMYNRLIGYLAKVPPPKVLREIPRSIVLIHPLLRAELRVA